MLYLSPLPPSCSSVGSGAFLGVCGFLVFLASSARSACASSFCFCSAVCLRSIFGLAAVANRSVKPTRLRRAAYFLSLVPSYSALCRPAFIPTVRLYQRFLLWGFGAAPGFACILCAGFKSFWPPALVQQALPAIIFAALRRFLGAVLFLGPRPSSRLGAPFWPSGLTVRRSRPPTAAAELRALVPVNLALQSSWFSQRPSPPQAFIRWAFGRVLGFAYNHFASFKRFRPPAHASQARAAMVLVALRIHAPFHRRG